jgi:hypothetical protein
MEEFTNWDIGLLVLILGVGGVLVYSIRENARLNKKKEVLFSKLENVISQELEKIDDSEKDNEKYKELSAAQVLLNNAKKENYFEYPNSSQIVEIIKKYNIKVS